MNLEQMRARAKEIQETLASIQEKEVRTNEDLDTINNLFGEFEVLSKNIDAEEKMEAMNAKFDNSSRKVSAKAPAFGGVQVGVTKKDQMNAGFENAGEFFCAVANHKKGVTDERLFRNQHVEKVGEDGGFLIPSDFRTSIKEKVEKDESILGMTDIYETGSNRLELPVSETAAWGSNGMQAYWEGEAEKFKESKEKIGMAEWRLHKITAYTKASQELLSDAPAMESFIQKKAPEAIGNKVNQALISGTGAGMPEGILNSAFRIVVPKEAAQAAGTVNYLNLVNMETQFISEGGVWLASPAIKKQLRLLKDENDNYIYLGGSQFPNAAAAPFDVLMGKRIMFLKGCMEALGKEGDIILADLKYLVTALKTTQVRSEISTHVHFDEDLTAFKFVSRIGGGCPFKSPIVDKNGFEMSGFMTLAERA